MEANVTCCNDVQIFRLHNGSRTEAEQKRNGSNIKMVRGVGARGGGYAIRHIGLPSASFSEMGGGRDPSSA